MTHALVLPQYNDALRLVLSEFHKRYIPDNDDVTTKEELDSIISSIESNSEVIKELFAKYLKPVFQKAILENGDARREHEEAMKVYEFNNASAISVNQQEKRKGKRRISTWQIYLTYANKLIPGYKESNRKISLCKENYKLLTEDEIKNLCDKYFEEHPNSVPIATKGLKQSTKRGGISGWAIFSQEWYADQKKKNPEMRGLRSKACGQAWKDLSEEERELYNHRANETKNMNIN